ncbi:helix-turn-helix domain-containing protein [Streptomyces durbertensis]|uniref:Helix-turn-helix domain-containing protein n=1 Tax=Streptomyces durbertensis TaxID=2448886 RepID=A0ABR6EDL3_9ACTN|nr:helix-turn-helix domain-containing protein [Streptomyces durbertensis]MBB1243429.1 helix-turn-helix domain-containing protein [Streptomyces durbertensis]
MPSRTSRVLEQPLFGRRLRALRTARGMSQARLAGTEFSAAYLSRLESGERPPTERVLSYLCSRLDVSPAAFRGSAGSPLARALATASTVGESPRMATILEDALQEEAEGDAALRWQAHWLLAKCYRSQAMAVRELEVLRELVRLSDDVDLPDLRARSRVRLARALRAAGELGTARRHATEALAMAEEQGLTHHDLVESLMALVSIDAEAGRLAEARAGVDRMLDRLSAEVPVRLRVEALWTAATVHVRQGLKEAAGALLEQALGILASNEDPVLWMRLRLAAASLYLQMDPRDTARAAVRLEEAGAAAALIGMPLHQHEVLILRGQLAFYQGDHAEARRLVDQLRDGPGELSMRDGLRLEVLRNQLAIVEGDRTTAVSNMERMAKKAQESSNVELSAEVWRALAEALTAAVGTVPTVEPG